MTNKIKVCVKDLIMALQEDSDYACYNHAYLPTLKEIDSKAEFKLTEDYIKRILNKIIVP